MMDALGRRRPEVSIGVDVNELAVLRTTREPDYAGLHGEQGVVIAAAHVGAGVEFGTTLTDDDGTRLYEFSTECLYAEHLGV
jgi:hypothetical protein